MSLIRWGVPVVVLVIACSHGRFGVVDCGTWRPSTLSGLRTIQHSQHHQHRLPTLSSYAITHPSITLLRGGGGGGGSANTDTTHHQSRSSAFPTTVISGGSTTTQHPSTIDAVTTTPSLSTGIPTVVCIDDSTLTSPSQPPSASIEDSKIETSTSTSSATINGSSFQHRIIPEYGGAIFITDNHAIGDKVVVSRSKETENETETASSSSSSISVKAAIKEFKLRRKLEKEQRKRHKQIAKQLRVGAVSCHSAVGRNNRILSV
jgi:hypothetical protein